MFCRNCGQQTDETKTGYCDSCGQPLGEGIYAPPQGYAFDKSCGLYYQSSTTSDSESGEELRRVVWFDPQSGEYHVTTYPQEAAAEMAAPEPKPEPEPVPQHPDSAATAPVPQHPDSAVTAPQGPDSGVTPPAPQGPSSAATAPPPAPPPAPEPVLQPIQPPVGFTLDAATGLYCRATQTAEGWSTTWFDPESNSYTQQQYAAQPKPAQPAAAEIAPKSGKPGKPGKASKPAKAANPQKPDAAIGAPGKKQGKAGRKVVVSLLALALVLGGGGAAWYFGLLDGVLARFVPTSASSQTASDSSAAVAPPSSTAPAPSSANSAPASSAPPSSTAPAPSSASSAPASSQPSTSGSATSSPGVVLAEDSGTLPVPANFELVVFPISPRQALFRISGLDTEQTLPAHWPDLSEDRLIYEWSVRFGRYRAAIMVSNKNNQQRESYRLQDFTASVWQEHEDYVDTLPDSTVQLTAEDGVMEMLVTLPEPTPFDFTTQSGYSFCHYYLDNDFIVLTHAIADAASYQQLKSDGVFISRNLPEQAIDQGAVRNLSADGDKTGYVDSYDWYGHQSKVDPAIPNGKWMTASGERVVYLDHPVNLGTMAATVVMLNGPNDYRAISCTLIRAPGEERFAWQATNSGDYIWLDPQPDGSIRLGAIFGGTGYADEEYTLVWTKD